MRGIRTDEIKELAERHSPRSRQPIFGRNAGLPGRGSAMVPVLTRPDDLRRLFAAVTEQTFQAELGVADPRLIDYLVDLLLRFVRSDAIYRVRSTSGRRLEEVADMLAEAEQRQARPKREIHRHIGDYTLFWSGVYPEALPHLKAPERQDHLVSYLDMGKRSYYIASTFDDGPYEEEAPVLRRLSEEFEMCSYGLNRVRQECQRNPGGTLADEAGE